MNCIQCRERKAACLMNCIKCREQKAAGLDLMSPEQKQKIVELNNVYR